MRRAPAFWEREGTVGRLLAPSASLYGAIGALRQRVIRPVRAPIPVVCVGNLVVGGAGKTPVVLSVLERLAGRGVAAHAITRGYGGRLPGPVRVDPGHHSAAEVGDEALLLARAAPTWVAHDRAAAARAATAAGAAVLVLDDGLQNPALAKDLSLLVLDGGYGLGNGRLLPAGPLREPAARALARVGAVVIMGEDRRGLAALAGDTPLLHARLEPAPGAPDLAGRRVMAFAGIARPAKLVATLVGLGAEVIETHAFPDHHPYTPAEAEALLTAARRLDAVPVTTEKDAVRLPGDVRAAVTVLPVRVAWAEPAALDALLAPLVGDVRTPAS